MQPYEAEQLTRTKRIDPRLHAAGWSVTAPCELDEAVKVSKAAVKELPTAHCPLEST
jgi:type I site-specific restriction endonuclease